MLPFLAVSSSMDSTTWIAPTAEASPLAFVAWHSYDPSSSLVRGEIWNTNHGLFWLVPLQQWHNIVFVLTSTQPVTSCFSGPPRVWIARLSRSPGRSSIFFPLRIWKKKPIIIIITLILEIQLQIPYWLCDIITELSNPCGLLTGLSLILWLWWRNHLTSSEQVLGLKVCKFSSNRPLLATLIDTPEHTWALSVQAVRISF